MLFFSRNSPTPFPSIFLFEQHIFHMHIFYSKRSIPTLFFFCFFFSFLHIVFFPRVRFLHDSIIIIIIIIYLLLFFLPTQINSSLQNKMQIKFTSINVNGFNKSYDKLAHFINHNNIHFTVYKKHTQYTTNNFHIFHTNTIF